MIKHILLWLIVNFRLSFKEYDDNHNFRCSCIFTTDDFVVILQNLLHYADVLVTLQVLPVRPSIRLFRAGS